jgi:hypothetical protein
MFTAYLVAGSFRRAERSSLSLGALTLAGSLALAACAPAPQAAHGSGEIDWARAALARNPAIEVVSADEKARAVTVRDKATGALRTVRVDELVAEPPAASGAATDSAATAAPAAAAPAAVAQSGAAAGAAGGSSVPAPGEPAAAPGAGPAADSAAGPAAGTGAGAGRNEYAIERDRSGVHISGPGVSITSSGGSGAAGAGGTASSSVSPGAGARSGAVEMPVERRSEPLRCQGAKFLRLDNQRLAFAGDGIVAERGCELYLTNSRVEALGTAIVADAAKIHITNCAIVGGTASLQLQNGGDAYVGGSILKGISRRFDSSELHDLGGNRWN